MFADKKLSEKSDDGVTLLEIIKTLYKEKYKIAIFTAVFSLLTILYVLSVPNIYKSAALLAPVEDNNLNSMGGYSNIAAIAGISLPKDSGNKSIEALERIQSYEFFSTTFLPTIKLQNLMAVSSWNSQSAELNYDSGLYNSQEKKWTISQGISNKPTQQSAFRIYKDIINISKANETGFITLSIEHQSPLIAQQWVEKIYTQINMNMREESKSNVTKRIQFLNKQLIKTNYAEIKNALSELVKDQTQILMLAEANEEYVFKVIDSPIVPELKKGPNRALLCILGFLSGMLLSSLYFLMRLFLRKADKISL